MQPIEGIIISFSRKSDGSYKIVISTQELESMDVAEIASVCGKFGKFSFEEKA